MNRTDLVNEVAKVLGTRKQAETAVDCVLDTITTALQRQEKVTLSGFGAFSISKRAARKGRNPQTGKEIDIAAKNVPKFTPGKALQEAVK